MRSGSPTFNRDMMLNQAALASMRLRAERPRVTRLSRKVLVGGAAIGSLAIFGAVIWALQNNRSELERRQPNSTPPTTQRRRWPCRTSAGTMPAYPAGPAAWTAAARRSRPSDLERAERAFGDSACGRRGATAHRSGDRSGALSRLFASTGIRESALPSAQSASTEAATSESAWSTGSNPPLMRPSRRMARTANSPSSTRRSIVERQARTGSPRRRHPTCCRRAASFRRRSSPAFAPTCRARSPPR